MEIHEIINLYDRLIRGREIELHNLKEELKEHIRNHTPEPEPQEPEPTLPENTDAA